MTSKTTKLSFPNALVSSTLGTVLVSMISVWLATAALQPAPATDTAEGLHSHSPGAKSHRLFRVPLVPPGADWTA
jgi:hypothetical protein